MTIDVLGEPYTVETIDLADDFTLGHESALSHETGHEASHDVWSGGNMAPRLMQPADDIDVEIENATVQDYDRHRGDTPSWVLAELVRGSRGGSVAVVGVCRADGGGCGAVLVHQVAVRVEGRDVGVDASHVNPP